MMIWGAVMKAKKSLAKMYKYRPEDEELFKDVVFLVEATHHEQFCFWQDYHHKPKYDNCSIQNWEQISMGRMITIGELDNRPICICIYWAKLEGYKVMFYEAVSQVVDHAMVEKWIKHFSLDKITWDNGHRWAHCDSNNFHHCIHAIQQLQERDGKSPKQREKKIQEFLDKKQNSERL